MMIRNVHAPPMPWIMRRIVIAGCLAMVYLNLSGGAQQVAFLRASGATNFNFGVIGALAPGMLLLQFVAGLTMNRMRRRKRFWIVWMVIHRTLFLPFALLPWLFPASSSPALVSWMIVILAIDQGMATFAQPLFFAWMGDLLPHENLNEYWAERQKKLCVAQAVSLLGVSAFFYVFRAVDIRITYFVVAGAAVISGVVDILMFIKIPEPECRHSPHSGWRRLIEPFRNKLFRRLIVYMFGWSFAAFVASPFLRLFLLREVGIGIPVVELLFVCHALGGAMFAVRIGRAADRYGHRPIIVLCTALKSVIVLAFFVMRPGLMILWLVPVLLLDNMLNTGMVVARNGFILKLSPSENRAMFVAAVLATSGIAGAAGALCGGILLERLPDFPYQVMGSPLSGFRLVMLFSAVLRLLAFILARRIHEPESSRSGEVLVEFVGPSLMRWIRIPIGYFSHH